MKYIDIHCHLDSSEFDNDREEILARMREKGVGAITVGASIEESKKAVEIAEANENIWATIGIHPEICQGRALTPKKPLFFNKIKCQGQALTDFDDLGGVWGELGELVLSKKVIAIGECGLDYFRLDSEEEKKKQKILFESQIQFAIKYDKPLMLHVRNDNSTSSGQAYGDVLEILQNYKKEAGEKLRGNVHFFAGDVSVAQKFLDLGFTLSFTGVITFTHDYDEVIKYIPQNYIMSETDAPFVAPVPYRGKRNEPNYVIEVAKKMAEIRGEDKDILAKLIINNAKRIFGVW